MTFLTILLASELFVPKNLKIFEHHLPIEQKTLDSKKRTMESLQINEEDSKSNKENDDLQSQQIKKYKKTSSMSHPFELEKNVQDTADNVFQTAFNRLNLTQSNTVTTETVIILGQTKNPDKNNSSAQQNTEQLFITNPEQTQYLMLGNRRISEFSFLSAFDQLIYLDLNNTQLQEMPQEIFSTKQLKYVFLENNNISNIPCEIRNLSNLQYLNIVKNKISDLSVLKTLPKLQILKIQGNPIKNIPVELLQVMMRAHKKPKIYFDQILQNIDAYSVKNIFRRKEK